MSVDKSMELRSNEIDKSKRRHRTDDTVVATAALTGGGDSQQYAKMENADDGAGKPTDLCLQSNLHLVSSTTSSLADTPGDSGVLCLDSEASEVTSQALMSHSLVGAEELACDSLYDAAPSCSQDMIKSTTSSLMTRSDIDNQNMGAPEDIVPELLVEANKKSPVYENLPDVVLKALESEKVSTENIEKPTRVNEPKKSLSEDIVYRRKCRKKSQSGGSSQKKRVSFHEDILNNTKTDNIHIERGFISYIPDNTYCDRFRQKNNIPPDRFSWCASGDRSPKYAADVVQQTMSDLLVYGDSKADRSGVFEYCQDYDNENQENDNKDKDNNNETRPRGKLYGCDSNSSDSNFSCDSETSSSDSSSSHSNKTEATLLHRKCDKAQKSYSCDGFENNAHVAFMRKTYFSEADIDQPHDRTKKPLEVTESPNRVKSVLKKKRYITTNVVEEKKQNSKVLNLLDVNIIYSLKSFYKNFNFNFTPEKGLPENSIELTNVVEALPDVNQNKKLSKSLDSGFQIDDEDDFVEINLNGQQLEAATPKEMVSSTKSNIAGDRTPKEGSPRHKLTLNMKAQYDKKSANKSDAFPSINKYVVNCESTVYEHKGVSYSYVHDTFQTAFDAPKETFVPIPESTPVKELVTSTSKADFTLKQTDTDSSSRASTPKRQFNKNVQDETEQKNGIPKHLSSPKRQNVNRYSRKSASTQQKTNEEQQQTSDNCSNTDNSTLKGGEDFADDFFDSPSQKLNSDKSALLNRYLKNVCQRKDLELKIRNNKFFQNKLRMEKGFPSIIYPFEDVSDTFHVSAARMSRLVDKEVIENKRLSVRLLTADEPSYFDSFEDNVAIECNEKLRLQIFSYPNETLNRMMKVQSQYNMEDGVWTPLLVFITDYALYVAGLTPGGTQYDILCRLPHNELDAIAVGPEAQYVQIIDISGNIACSIVTGESSLGVRLVSSLEWSARTSPLRVPRPPAIIPLSCKHLAAEVARQRHQDKVSEILYYGRAWSGDAGDRLIEAPGAFAPPLEGYLMCRTDRSKRFEPCYFLLRAGVLQWGPHPPDTNTSLPNAIALRSVVGVRRHVDSSRRPHCFEIAMNTGARLLLAAPDDPAASSWLQSLLLHAAQALEEKDGLSAERSGPPCACTVLVTAREVLSVREPLDLAFVAGAAAYLKERQEEALLKEYIAEMRTDVEILACGSLKNLTAFKIPDTDENWCCLEWSVCEARERGSGLALVMASGAELERLIAAVERAFCALTSEPFPLSVVEASKSACSTAHSKFEAAWTHMLPQQ
ncbi:uncharacterized protein LOC133526479 [Cydia pomonella]|uniref:uncharacterized protein LOC133526479 n=1 Tax=Cydia pomonella TaxID=82600 RepID=UPI002ADDA4FA|nr:uncharacterized protein LOC133526479 [Cydia pomonella]